MYNPFVLWFTGLPASGKTTLSCAFSFRSDVDTCVLDANDIRKGLNSNLGFSPEDRSENIRRLAEVAKLFVDRNIITSVAAITPYKADRDNARNIIRIERFVEIFCDCSVEECIKRDPKGLYKKAIAGEIQNFIGISDLYEKPIDPEIILETDKLSIPDCLEIISIYLARFK